VLGLCVLLMLLCGLGFTVAVAQGFFGGERERKKGPRVYKPLSPPLACLKREETKKGTLCEWSGWFGRTIPHA
jgi:hypothetical protein